MQEWMIIQLTPYPEYNFFFTLMIIPMFIIIPTVSCIILAGKAL